MSTRSDLPYHERLAFSLELAELWEQLGSQQNVAAMFGFTQQKIAVAIKYRSIGSPLARAIEEKRGPVAGLMKKWGIPRGLQPSDPFEPKRQAARAEPGEEPEMRDARLASIAGRKRPPSAQAIEASLSRAAALKGRACGKDEWDAFFDGFEAMEKGKSAPRREPVPDTAPDPRDAFGPPKRGR